MKIVRPLSVSTSASFTRSSVGTFFDKNGIMQSAAVDAPRFSYDPSSLTKPPALLIEKAATNLLWRSEALNDTAAWARQGSTVVTADSTDGPDAAISMDSVYSSAGTTDFLYQVNTVSLSTNYVFSIYVKQGGSTRSCLAIYNASGVGAVALGGGDITWVAGVPTLTSELVTGTVSIGPAIKATVGTLYRISVTCNSSIYTAIEVLIYPDRNSTGATLNAGYAQLETGTVASSYIKTPILSSASRSADVMGVGMLSTLTETDAPTYDMTKCYVIGDRVMVSSVIFESLVGTTSGVTVTSATPGVVTWINHGLVINDGFRFVSGTAPTGTTLNTTYYVISVSNINNFTFSATLGGGAVATTSTGSSLVATSTENLNFPPASNLTKWVTVSPTNKWAMFDSSAQSETIATDAINVAIRLSTTSLVDSFVGQNVTNASAARITMYDATDGLVYDKTINLISNSGIRDLYAYLYEPIVYLDSFLVMDLPHYANAIISVSFSNTGRVVSCGSAVLGLSKTIGWTQAGLSIGIQDYSVKSTDEFGNITIIERPYSSTMNATVWVDSTQRKTVLNLLNGYRATPIVYIGDENDMTTVLLGYFKDYTDGIDQPTVSTLHIEIESLK